MNDKASSHWIGVALIIGLTACAPSQPPTESPSETEEADATTIPSPPAGFDAVPVPDDNPITAEKVELGRFLFFDKRLSLDGTYSCASCHQPEKAFTDGLDRAVIVK